MLSDTVCTRVKRYKRCNEFLLTNCWKAVVVCALKRYDFGLGTRRLKIEYSMNGRS